MEIFLKVLVLVGAIFVNAEPNKLEYWDSCSPIINIAGKPDNECHILTVNRPKSTVMNNNSYHSGIGPSYKLCLCTYSDWMHDTIKKSGGWEDCIPLKQLWHFGSKQYPLIQNKIFVDVGGHTGSCAVMMANAGVRRVIAFEPSPKNQFYFTSSVKLSNIPCDRLKLYPFALGNQSFSTTVYSQKNNGGNTLMEKPLFTDFSKYTVAVKTLDEVLWPIRTASPPAILVMKLDIQGYELKALQGARSLLAAKAIKLLKIEIAPLWLRNQGTTALAICDFVTSFGYSIAADIDKLRALEFGTPESLCGSLDIKSKTAGNENAYTDVYAIVSIQK